MTLYHGSNCDIARPDPRRGHAGTDFGRGFYLTPDMESARKMASLVTTREGEGRKTINVFDFDEASAAKAELAIRRFTGLDEEWMRFVVANRSFERDAADHNLDRLYDVVIGFIADDKIRNLIRLYREKMMTIDVMLNVMKERPWRVMQYSFHTAKAVRFLKLQEVWHGQ